MKASLNLITLQGSPSDQFKAIDENGDGAVSFDEWLSFAYKNYQVEDPDEDNGLRIMIVTRIIMNMIVIDDQHVRD